MFSRAGVWPDAVAGWVNHPGAVAVRVWRGLGGAFVEKEAQAR